MKPNASSLIHSTPSLTGRVRGGSVILIAFILLTACGTSRKSLTAQTDTALEEHKERLSVGQSIFAIFDSLAVNRDFEADSLEVEIFEAGNLYLNNHSLAATRPPQSQAPGRLAARLKVKGIHSNTQLTQSIAMHGYSLTDWPVWKRLGTSSSSTRQEEWSLTRRWHIFPIWRGTFSTVGIVW